MRKYSTLQAAGTFGSSGRCQMSVGCCALVHAHNSQRTFDDYGGRSPTQDHSLIEITAIVLLFASRVPVTVTFFPANFTGAF